MPAAGGSIGSLRGWYDEWAETARAVVKRRDYLIRLGLAQRKSPAGGEPVEKDGAETPDE